MEGKGVPCRALRSDDWIGCGVVVWGGVGGSVWGLTIVIRGCWSHGGGVNGFVRVGMGGDIVEEAVKGGKVKLDEVGLVRGKLTHSCDDGQV